MEKTYGALITLLFACSVAVAQVSFNTETARRASDTAPHAAQTSVNTTPAPAALKENGITTTEEGNLNVPGTIAAPSLPANVMKYGADPTGTRDSSPAFTRCMNTGSSCYVPPGTYKLLSAVRYPNCKNKSHPVSLFGDPSAPAIGYPAIIRAPAGSAAFAPACPLTPITTISFYNLSIVGGKNGIDLGLSSLTSLHNLSFVDQSGYAITHLEGEKHEWKEIFIWHQTVQAIGGISLGDPTTAIDASVYAGDPFWRVNDGWFDRADLEDIKDQGNGNSPAPQDSYFIHMAPNTGGNVGSGVVGHTRIIKPVIMWAGAKRVFDFEGNVQGLIMEEPVIDIVGSSASPTTEILFIGGSASFMTLIGFNPALAPSAFYTNAINIRGATHQSAVIGSALGGNGRTTYGLRLGVGAPMDHITLLNDSGYVFNESSNAAYAYGAVSILGGQIASNMDVTSTFIANASNGDYRFYFPAIGPSNNCSNWRFSRGQTSSASVADDMVMGCNGVFFNLPLAIGSMYFTGAMNAHSYWTFTDSNTGGPANSSTLTIAQTNPGAGIGGSIVNTNNAADANMADFSVVAGRTASQQGAGIFRAYGKEFKVASLAQKVGVGSNDSVGSKGIVIVGSLSASSGAAGSISLRAGGYDSPAENLLCISTGCTVTHGTFAIPTPVSSDNSTNAASTAYVKSNMPLSGTTGSVGGRALAAGTCATGTATVTGATTGMAIAVTPVTYPGDQFFWRAYVSGANTVTVSVCTDLAAGGTPAAGNYNVRVIQ